METARTLLGKIVADVVQNAEKECMQMALGGEKLQFAVRKSGLRYHSRMASYKVLFRKLKKLKV